MKSSVKLFIDELCKAQLNLSMSFDDCDFDIEVNPKVFKELAKDEYFTAQRFLSSGEIPAVIALHTPQGTINIRPDKDWLDEHHRRIKEIHE